MKEIKIDNKVYLLKEDVEKEYTKNGEKSKFGSKLKILNSGLMDEANVLAVAHCKLENGFVVTSISTEYLERVINCLKAMSCNEEGLESIKLAWAKDYPAVIGTFNEKTNEVIGFMIAPRVER